MKALRASLHWTDRGWAYSILTEFEDCELVEQERTDEIALFALGSDARIDALSERLSVITTRRTVRECPIESIEKGWTDSLNERGRRIIQAVEAIK